MRIGETPPARGSFPAALVLWLVPFRENRPLLVKDCYSCPDARFPPSSANWKPSSPSPDYQKDHSCRETEDITENFTGDIIGHMPRATEEDALAAVERARKAQKAWAQVPVKERAKIFRRYHQLIWGKL
ncbi:MAG: aldehyde dehydrogenase family protein [Lawsonella clevelandensis]